MLGDPSLDHLVRAQQRRLQDSRGRGPFAVFEVDHQFSSSVCTMGGSAGIGLGALNFADGFGETLPVASEGTRRVMVRNRSLLEHSRNSRRSPSQSEAADIRKTPERADRRNRFCAVNSAICGALPLIVGDESMTMLRAPALTPAASAASTSSVFRISITCSSIPIAAPSLWRSAIAPTRPSSPTVHRCRELPARRLGAAPAIFR